MSTWQWFVYIAECQDGTFYTGCTWKIPNRAEQHASGFGSKYTKRHGFKKIVFVEEHTNLESARLRERQIKKWSQTKKKKLISGEWKKEW